MKVLTVGTFDIPHAGHCNFFQSIGWYVDTSSPYFSITIGLNTDEFVEKYKGKRPVFSYEERKELLSNFGEVVANDQPDGSMFDLLERESPNVLAIGSDWHEKDYLKQIGVTQSQLDELGIAVIYIPYTKGISTTEIKQRLCDE